MKKINIGLVIEQRINKLGLSKSEFGRRIGIPQQHVNRILEKESIDTDKLITISEALGYNFFLEYLDGDDVAGTATTVMSGAVNSNNVNSKVNSDNSSLPESFVRDLLAEKDRQIQTLLNLLAK